MKQLKTTLFLVGLLVLGCAFPTVAQSKAEKTSSAKAYYGTPPASNSYKVKQNVKRKKNKGYTNSKKARGKREGKKGKRPRAIL